MVLRPLRALTRSPNARVVETWLEQLADALGRPDADRADICRRTLAELSYPDYAANWETAVEDEALPLATRTALLALDPRNITLEPEYYAECDDAKFQRVKPLLWLWYSFDRTVLGGQNVDAGVRLRRLLAPLIFKRVGANFKCFQFVEFSFGYNLDVGDDVVVHRHVLLDDRGGIVLGNRVSIADYANIYSHSHELGDQRMVNTPVTELGEGVRVTYHATVLAGTRLEPDSMLGAMGLATKDVPAGQLALGIPAHARFSKPPLAERPALPATRDPLADPESG